MTKTVVGLLQLLLLVTALILLSRVKSRIKYPAIVLLSLAALLSVVWSSDNYTLNWVKEAVSEGFADASVDPAVITYGSVVEVQHSTTLSRDPVNSWLLADWMNYWHPNTSGQRQMAIAWGLHLRVMFRVKGTIEQGPDYAEGKPVVDGSIIRLQNRWETQGNLHSHDRPAPYNVAGFHEVTHFGTKEADDGNSYWQLMVEGGGPWKKGVNFALKHVNTGFFLHSVDYKHRVFPDPNNTWSLQAVFASPSKTADSLWQVYRVEQPGAAAVRIYRDTFFNESKMDEYIVVNSTEVVSNKLRDGRTGNEYIQSIIVPTGYAVDLYRSPNKTDYFATITEGIFDNQNLGKVATLVVRPACAIKVIENCDGSGRQQCLPYGTSEIPFGAMGWKTADANATVKVFNSDTEWLLPSGQKSLDCSKQINPSFGPATEVTVLPVGASMAMFRSADDPSSLQTFDVAADPANVPALSVPKQALRVYLNAANPVSYPGGRIWKDLSGNNKHFVWQTLPRFADGKLMTTDTDGKSCVGEPSNTFGLRYGTQGYTIAIACQSQGISQSWGCKFSAKNNEPHNISCHVPWSDGTLYFDQAWGSPSGAQNRLSVSPGTVWDKNLMNVIVLRRSANASGGKQSIWINGVKVAESAANYARELDLGPNNAAIFTNYRGSAQAFALYTVELPDSDIVSLTKHFVDVYDSYRVKTMADKIAIAKTNSPGLTVYSGLRCLLDARDSKSALYNSTIWKDLSGWNNDFKWLTTPSLDAGAFRQIDKAGTGALGPASDSMGIDGGGGDFTIFFVARTNALSENQAFRFSGDVGSSRAIFVHPTWTNELIMFDQNGCCSINQQRLMAKVTPRSLSVYAVRCTPSFAYNVILQRRGQDVWPTASLNRKAIFINGVKQVEGTQEAWYTLFNSKPVEIGASKTEPYDWKADISAFAVYNRALTDAEIAKVSAYLNKPKYGSAAKADGSTDSDPNIKPGVCVNKTTSNMIYSAAECLSKKTNSDGTFSRVTPNGTGWCYTDDKDDSKWGYCRQNRQIDINPSYDKTVPASYTGAREYCESKGARLCRIDELCDSGKALPAGVGYEALDANSCVAAGGVYNATGGYCGTQDSSGKTPFYVPAGLNFAPVDDYENAWVNISGDDLNKTCRTFDELNGTLPSWGTSTSDLPQKRNLVCCGSKTLTECDKIAISLKTIEDKIAEATDAATIGSLNMQRDTLKRQQMEKCLTETYLTAVTDLADAENLYTQLSTKVTNTRSDRIQLENQLKQLQSVTDSAGAVFFDVEDAKANKGVPFPDGTFKPTGMIPTLQQKLLDTQSDISKQIARYNACPKDPTCQLPISKAVSPPSGSDTTCDASTLKTALLNNPSLTPEKLQLLTTLLSDENVLKASDIRNHRDFYKLVKAQSVKSCSELGTGPALQPSVTEFDIRDHPDFKNQHLVPLTTVDLGRVPADRLPDAMRLQGKTTQDLLSQ